MTIGNTDRGNAFSRVLASEALNTTASSMLLVATPLIAMASLDASSVEVGMLAAAGTAAPLMLGLSAGALAERWERTRTLFWCGIARLLLVGVVPLLFLLDQLSIAALCLVSFGLSAVKLLFDSVVVAVIPTIVHRDRLTKANSWFEALNSTAFAIGPAIAGWLLQTLSASAAFLANAALYLASTLSLKGASLRAAKQETNEKRSHISDIAEGIKLLWRSDIHKAIAIAAGAFNLFHTAFFTVFSFFAIKELGFSAVSFGSLISVVGLFGLLAALCAPRLIEMLGPRTALVGSLLIIGPLGAPVLLADELAFPGRATVIACSLAAWDFLIVVHLIVEQTVRQVTVDNQHLSRITATTRFISWGVDPVGTLLGGLAASSSIGPRGTLFVCLLGLSLSGSLLLLSKGIRQLNGKLLEADAIHADATR
ncbi:MFS transporter [Paraburkholderia lacunae]|uniref:MFS transporter n=1 Tax=Paraburkholderia lacunae TaxID=2211104 RepID=A0A370N5J6_9BURK|nr:MFS transporter [Paraburkholderia lacunae]RDK00894.1 hypothetical protein DLM46_21410 [Paraburkholderia lacunae]